MAITDINIIEFRKLFDIATDVAHVGYWEWDIKTNEVLWARQKIEIYGENADTFEPSFEKFLKVIDEETKARVLNEIDLVLSGQKEYYDLQHKISLNSGKTAWVHEKAFVIYSTKNEPLRMVGIVYDITDQKLTLEKLTLSQKDTQYIKTHDQLTALYNKETLLLDIQKYKDNNEYAVMFLDIDDFKTLNSMHGHLLGDEILQKVATMLKLVAKDEAVYRYGSDEFAIVFESDKKENVLSELKKYFEKVINIGEISLRITISIGVSIYPKDGSSMEECIKNANSALSLAKMRGKNQTLFYESYMNTEISQKHLLLTNIQDAIDKEAFTTFFQPKINSQTNKIVGFESLVRWEKNGQVIPPSGFLNIATQNDLINKIDFIVLKKSLKQLKIWHDDDFKISVSVNFTNGDFESEEVYQLLLEYKEYLEFLTIEVTENELIGFNTEDLEQLLKLKELGLKLSLDDFGTGYSSLQYLHKLPIDELKIDKSFVDTIPGDKKDEDLVKIIKSIVDTFNLSCVVEGVEEEVQRDFFKDLGLYIIQGYIYSKPLPSAEATKFLKNNYK